MVSRLAGDISGVVTLRVDGADLLAADGAKMVTELQTAVEEIRHGPQRIRLVIIAVQNTDNCLSGKSQDAYVHSLPGLLQSLRGLPQVMYGLADGPMSSLATAVLSTCDYLMATRRTYFQHFKGNRCISLSSAQRSQLVHCVVADVAELHLRGEQLGMRFLEQPIDGPTDAEVKKMFFAGRKAARDAAKEKHKERRGHDWGQLEHAGQEGDEEDQEMYNYRPASSSAHWDPTMTGNGSTELHEGHLGQPSSSSRSGKGTTLILANLPASIDYSQVRDMIEELGFADKYDLIHLPFDGARQRHSGEGAHCYGFVNFRESIDAERFQDAFGTYEFTGAETTGPCWAAYAHWQGFTSALERCTSKYQNQTASGSLLVRL